MRAMMRLLPLLIMTGCGQQPGVTTMTRSSTDGEDTYSTKTWINASAGSFECRKSTSGQCNYVLFTENCGKNDPQSLDVCETKVVRKFTLKAGEKREFTDLPLGVKHCLNHDEMPVAPACDRQ